MEEKRETKLANLTSCYIVLTKKDDYYDWQIFLTKEKADLYIEQSKSMGFDYIVTTNKVDLSFSINKKIKLWN